MPSLRRPGLLGLYYAVLLVLLYVPIGVLFLFSVNDATVFGFRQFQFNRRDPRPRRRQLRFLFHGG